jgi:hypothetical protein
MPLILLDTNVLVYACDPGEPLKNSVLDGVRFVNPFVADFDLAAWM